MTISNDDQDYFENKYHNAELISPFHQFDHVENLEGTGDYIIYHGDLSVNENIIVAEYLISKIFSKLSFKCVIAGKNPPASLGEIASSFKNISIISDPDNDRMSDLIRNAQINLLSAIASNGLKLKLIIALFSGRHCLVNSNIIRGTTLAQACNVEDSADAIIEKINLLMRQPFTLKMITDRESILEAYSNSFNVRRLVRLIFPD
jgi:hypothetical protein